jgi:hypothetical protein
VANAGAHAAAYFNAHFNDVFQNPGGHLPNVHELVNMYPTHQEQQRLFQWLAQQQPQQPARPPPPLPPRPAPLPAAHIKEVPEEVNDEDNPCKSKSLFIVSAGHLLTVCHLLDLTVQFLRFLRDGEQPVNDRAKWPLMVGPNTFHEELCNKMGLRVQSAHLSCYFAHKKKANHRVMITNAHIRNMFSQAKFHLNNPRRAPATVYLIIINFAVSCFIFTQLIYSQATGYRRPQALLPGQFQQCQSLCRKPSLRQPSVR